MPTPTVSFVLQPGLGNHKDALGQLIKSPGGRRFDAAVAYVTNPGVNALLDTIAGSGATREWGRMEKRLLVGIDWLRSEPTAIERLAGIAGAQVRIHDGARVSSRKGCVPHVSWHPKTFVVTGPRVRAALHGSANLSGNGLINGHEVGSMIQTTARTGLGAQFWTAVDDLSRWFDGAWLAATPWSTISTEYHARYAAEYRRTPMPIDQGADDSGHVGTRRAMSVEQLVALASGQVLWIETGNVSKNRGPSRPGNQIMMKALTRVFFGELSGEVSVNTTFRPVAFVHASTGELHTGTLRYGDNGMDILTVPVPGAPWPHSYDNVTLQFAKRPAGADLLFEMKALTPTQARDVQRRSADGGTSWAMQSGGRKWGVL